MTKPSVKKLKSLIAEEKQASKAYRKMGYPTIARDESRHRKRLEEELKRRRNK